MSEAKHTPGPWRIEPMHGICADVESMGKKITATVAVVHKRGGTEQTSANARLIAASPDLLTELKTSHCPGGGWNGMSADTEPTVENCMNAGACGCSAGAAIAKATAPAGQPQP